MTTGNNATRDTLTNISSIYSSQTPNAGLLEPAALPKWWPLLTVIDVSKLFSKTLEQFPFLRAVLRSDFGFPVLARHSSPNPPSSSLLQLKIPGHNIKLSIGRLWQVGRRRWTASRIEAMKDWAGTLLSLLITSQVFGKGCYRSHRPKEKSSVSPSHWTSEKDGLTENFFGKSRPVLPKHQWKTAYNPLPLPSPQFQCGQSGSWSSTSTSTSTPGKQVTPSRYPTARWEQGQTQSWWAFLCPAEAGDSDPNPRQGLCPWHWAGSWSSVSRPVKANCSPVPVRGQCQHVWAGRHLICHSPTSRSRQQSDPHHVSVNEVQGQARPPSLPSNNMT